MTIRALSSPFFFVVCSSCSPQVYYFNPKTNECMALEADTEEDKFNKKTIKYTAAKDGYYIVVVNKKINALVKGNMKYCAFMLNNKNASENVITITAYFIDGTKSDKSFVKLIDNIYYCDLSDEIRIGWFENSKISPINKKLFSDTCNITLVTKAISTHINENVTSNTEKQTINSTIKEQSLSSYNSKTNKIYSSISYNSINTEKK